MPRISGTCLHGLCNTDFLRGRFPVHALVTQRSASCWRSPVLKLAAEVSFHPFCKGKSPPSRFDTVPRRLPFHHPRGILHTIILVNCLRSNGLLPTTQQSSHIGRYPSFPRFLHGKLDRSQLVVFGIVARLSGYSHWPFHPRVDEISMAALSSSVHKARMFKLGNEISHFWWH